MNALTSMSHSDASGLIGPIYRLFHVDPEALRGGRYAHLSEGIFDSILRGFPRKRCAASALMNVNHHADQTAFLEMWLANHRAGRAGREAIYRWR